MKHLFSLIETLEPRINPSDLTAVISGHTLKITGTAGADHLVVMGDAGNNELFHLQGASGDTINGQSMFDSTKDITTLKISLGNGDDSLTFSTTGAPVAVKGSLTITGGNEFKQLTATDLTVGGDLTIAYGNNETTNRDATSFTDLQVGGAMTVTTKSGDTSLIMVRDAGGTSAVDQNFTVKNGAGSDALTMDDMSFGGMVTINDGHGSSMNPSTITIVNAKNTNFPSQYAKGISVSFLDHAMSFTLSDAAIAGSVAVHDGSGDAAVTIGSTSYAKPVSIGGSLTINGTGDSQINLNVGAGLNIGKALAIETGTAGSAVALRNVQVGGSTLIAAKGGVQTLKIDDSIFAGNFTCNTPQGDMTASIEKISGTSVPTIFEKAATFHLGLKNASNPSFLDLAAIDDGFEVVILDGGLGFTTGPGGSVAEAEGHVLAPFFFVD